MNTKLNTFLDSVSAFTQRESSALGLDLHLIQGHESLNAFYLSYAPEIEALSKDPLFNCGRWLTPWLSVYADVGAIPLIFAAYNSNKLVGVAAVSACNINFQGKCLLQPLGQGEAEHEEVLSEYQDILCAEDIQHPFFVFISAFINRYCYRVKWQNTLVSSNVCRLLNDTSTNTALSRFTFEQNHATPVQALSKNNKKQYNRLMNKLSNEDHRFYWAKPQEQPVIFEKLIHLHNARWASQEKMGAMRSKKFIDFHQRIIHQKDIAKFSVLEINQTVVAVHYYLSFANTLYFYQSGWLNDQYADLSPGFLLHIWSINHSTEAQYDFMIAKSDNRLKRQLSNKQETSLSIDYKIDKLYCSLSSSLQKIKNKLAKRRNHNGQ